MSLETGQVTQVNKSEKSLVRKGVIILGKFNYQILIFITLSKAKNFFNDSLSFSKEKDKTLLSLHSIYGF